MPVDGIKTVRETAPSEAQRESATRRGERARADGAEGRGRDGADRLMPHTGIEHRCILAEPEIKHQR
jgi:hypothetical protein